MVRRAMLLETKFRFEPLTIDKKAGGAFTDRPSRRRFGPMPVIWHDFGLALVYGACFGAWVFLATDGGLRIWFREDHTADPIMTLLWVIPVVVFLVYTGILVVLATINDRENEVIDRLIESLCDTPSDQKAGKGNADAADS